MFEKFYPNLKDIIPDISITDKYLILDLDETLISTQDESSSSLKNLNIINNSKYLHIRERIYHFVLENVDAPGHGHKCEIWGITRPHINKFLIFCMTYFKGVYVWSAGKREYVDMIVDFLFKDLKRPEIVFSADDTLQREGNVLKPLNILYKKYPFMNSENTVTLDDNMFAIRDNRENAILIPAYNPKMSIEACSRNDMTLIQIIKWLKMKNTKMENNIQKINKDTIFSTSVTLYKEVLKREK